MKIKTPFFCLLSKLGRDERGSILIQFTITIVVIIGMIGLALDGGRFFMLNNDLQALADAAALAAAKQLDGASDALTRADAAARNLNNDVRWWDVAGPKILAGTGGVEFFQTLADIDSSNPTSDPTKANFVKVTTGIWQVAPTFLVAVGAVSKNSTQATAVAGSTFVACNVQPLMLCNPSEPSQFSANPGDLYGFTVTGNTGGYSPGDFSLLDPAGQTHSSAGDIENELAASLPNFCYVNTVSPAQGQKTIDVASGVNVRFDINPTGNPKGIDATPAPNVIKGDDTNKCLNSQNVTSPPQNNPTIDLSGDAMPINVGMTAVGSSSIGGTWNTATANSYWSAHHDSSGWPLIAGVPATRYQVYQMERAGSVAWNGTSAETPAPQCASVPTGDDSRRIISVAIVNCLAQNISGNRNATVMSNTYADFFLTRPVDQSGIVYAEFVRFMTPQSDGTKLHQIIQLYR